MSIPSIRLVAVILDVCLASTFALATPAPPFPIPTVQIRANDSTKIEMPVIGLGTAFGFSPPGSTNTTYDAVKAWIQGGGRAIHAARMYCNQEAIGQAIRDSGVPRSELFVMTMVPQWHMGEQETMDSVAVSLKQLGLDYVDLAMLHWPGEWGWQFPAYSPGDPRCGASPLPPCLPNLCGESIISEPACKQGAWSWRGCRQQTWSALNRLQNQGLVRAVGVSNFEIWMLDELQPPPAVNQIPYRVGFHDDLLLEHCVQQGTLAQVYSPLASGVLAQDGNSTTQLLLKSISEAHRVSPAQVALRFIVQNGAALVPKASSTNYMQEDVSIFNFTLTTDEMSSLARLNSPSAEGDSGGNDAAAMMCQNTTSGRMTRCLYLDWTKHGL